jgi:hypothetical protein
MKVERKTPPTNKMNPVVWNQVEPSVPASGQRDASTQALLALVHEAILAQEY